MVVVSGDAELRANLRSVGNAPSVKEIDAIAVSALQPMKDETVALAPNLYLKRGAVVRRRIARGKAFREYWLSFRRGIAMRIAHLVEFGTQPHSLRKGASVRKGIFVGEHPMHPGSRPHPFMRPAFETTKLGVIKSFGAQMWAAISGAAIRQRTP